MDDPTCYCLIWHAHTPAEREDVAQRIAYARSVGDVQALPLLIEHLNSGACLAAPAVTS